VHVIDDTTDYRLAINVTSKLNPSELLYIVDENFQHPLLSDLEQLNPGFHELDKEPGGAALDFIRGNLFDPSQMRSLRANIPGPNNDLNEKIDFYMQLAMDNGDALIYAFGERFGPENKKDKYFGFLPGNGIHDIHMNQGNVGKFTEDDGVWQDGGLIIHDVTGDRWIAIFLAFQSQAWHTDDETGHTIPGAPPRPIRNPPITGGTSATTNDVQIIAAMVNPVGPDDTETVTLINTSNKDIDLSGWAIANKTMQTYTLSGIKIKAHKTEVIQMPKTVPLSNKGGTITLLDPRVLKVHGVSYTKQDASREGRLVTF
jgi:uncharacterized protein YukJ